MENTDKSLLQRVLVVDDSKMDLMIAQISMKKYAFADQVELKISARAALDYLLSLQATPDLLPQLIFLDINMPELSGFDFLDEYAKLPAVIQKNCIIMMLSTSLAKEDHERANSNKFVCKFLNKPLDRSKLDHVKEELTDGTMERDYFRLLETEY